MDKQKKIIKITENDIVRIVKKVLIEQDHKGGGSTNKNVISVGGNKISATESGNIKIIDQQGNVYLYKMEVKGFNIKVVDFGKGTITIIDPTPLVGGDEEVKEFKEDSPAMKTIKEKLGSSVIVTKTKDGDPMRLIKLSK